MKKNPIIFIDKAKDGVWKYWGRRNSNGKLILYAMSRLEDERSLKLKKEFKERIDAREKDI